MNRILYRISYILSILGIVSMGTILSFMPIQVLTPSKNFTTYKAKNNSFKLERPANWKTKK